MSMRLTLSLDAMGGDDAPLVIVEGIDRALDRHPDVDFLLFGDETQLTAIVERFPRVKAVAWIHHTDEVITNDQKPGTALRSGKNSSMRLAINAVASGQAAGVVSAGNTGALMAMAKFVLKTLPGIGRPAIATCYPTLLGESVMLDLGANVGCDADNLVQFAVMGEVFARHVLGLDKPSVGILNIGAEGPKGNVAVRGASLILQDTNLPIKFSGFVEGDDIGAGTVDVVVTDGFTGNIALKTTEGTVKLVAAYLKEALASTPLARLGALLARPALNTFSRRLDPRYYNGAMFLGLNGICVKSHGGTDALGFANAIHVAVELIADGVNEGIKKDFAQLCMEPHDGRRAAAG